MPFDINQKWWENFWYYYKFHVFAGIFVALLVIVSIRDCMDNVTPDLSLACQGLNAQLPQYEQLEQSLSAVVQDVDGDGKQFVQLVTLLDEQKLFVLLAARDVQVLILNRDYLERYASQGALQPLDRIVEKYNLDLTASPEIRFTVQDDSGKPSEPHVYGIPLMGNAFLQQFGIAPTDAYLCLVIENPTAKEREAAMYVNAYAVLDKILRPAP